MKSNIKKNIIISLLICALLLPACSNTTNPQQQLQTTNTLPLPTATTLPTNTPASTNTPLPSPTISWPVYQNTPLPDLMYPVIAKDNIALISEIGKFGNPEYLNCQPIFTGNYSMIAATLGGFEFYKNGNDQPDKVNVQLNVYSKRTIINGTDDGFGISTDGALILAFTKDNRIIVITPTGEVIFEREVDIATYNGFLLLPSASISPDGKLIALSKTSIIEGKGLDSRTEIIDLVNGDVIKELRGEAPIFSPDGKYLEISFDSKIEFYTTSDWKMVQFLGQPLQSIQNGNWAIQFSPSGNLLAYMYEEKVEIYRVEDLKLVRSFKAFEPQSWTHPDVVFSTDEQKIMVYVHGRDPKDYLVDIATGDLITERTTLFPACLWKDAKGEARYYEVKSSYEMDLSSLGSYFSNATGENQYNEYEIRTTSEEYRFELIKSGKKIAEFNGLDYNSVIGATDNVILVYSSINGPGKAFMQIIDSATWRTYTAMGQRCRRCHNR